MRRRAARPRAGRGGGEAAEWQSLCAAALAALPRCCRPPSRCPPRRLCRSAPCVAVHGAQEQRCGTGSVPRSSHPCAPGRRGERRAAACARGVVPAARVPPREGACAAARALRRQTTGLRRRVIATLVACTAVPCVAAPVLSVSAQPARRASKMLTWQFTHSQVPLPSVIRVGPLCRHAWRCGHAPVPGGAAQGPPEAHGRAVRRRRSAPGAGRGQARVRPCPAVPARTEAAGHGRPAAGVQCSTPRVLLSPSGAAGRRNGCLSLGLPRRCLHRRLTPAALLPHRHSLRRKLACKARGRATTCCCAASRPLSRFTTTVRAKLLPV